MLCRKFSDFSCFVVAAASAGVLLVACGTTPRDAFGTDRDDASVPTAPNDQTVLGDFDGGALAPSCSPSPANFEIPNNGCDDDGNGKVDDAVGCDTGLPISGDAKTFAKALGLCQSASGPQDAKWGVISVTYSNGFGRTDPPNEAQHGILPKFGNVIKPREGKALGVLSTGFAREFDVAVGSTGTFKKDGFDVNGDPTAMQTTGGLLPTAGQLPPGFPKPAQGCQIDKKVFDTIDVKLEVKVPANAKGLAFDFNFWSGEWPEYVCTKFNDGFVAYLKSSAFNGSKADNISFDAQNNPVSVNNGFFDRCTPNTTTGCAVGANGVEKTATCPGGPAELQGTGFGSPSDDFCDNGGAVSTPGGATGWLSSTAPVTPGEVISLEFLIWDTGDPNFDSSVLLDNFRWVPGEVHTVTERPK